MGWLKLCNSRQSAAFMGISGDMKVYSEFFFIIVPVRINQA